MARGQDSFVFGFVIFIVIILIFVAFCYSCSEDDYVRLKLTPTRKSRVKMWDCYDQANSVHNRCKNGCDIGMTGSAYKAACKDKCDKDYLRNTTMCDSLQNRGFGPVHPQVYLYENDYTDHYQKCRRQVLTDEWACRKDCAQQRKGRRCYDKCRAMYNAGGRSCVLRGAL